MLRSRSPSGHKCSGTRGRLLSKVLTFVHGPVFTNILEIKLFLRVLKGIFLCSKTTRRPRPEDTFNNCKNHPGQPTILEDNITRYLHPKADDLDKAPGKNVVT